MEITQKLFFLKNLSGSKETYLKHSFIYLRDRVPIALSAWIHKYLSVLSAQVLNCLSFQVASEFSFITLNV